MEWSSVLVTGGAGFIGSNLVLEIEKRHPECRVTVVDDFRSGSYANLRRFHGDLLALDLAAADLEKRFSARPPSAVFHLASITDTTVEDERLMVHDNVEGFRQVMKLCRSGDIPLVYASSAAVYGIRDDAMSEETPAQPANAYAFSKMLLDNLAREAMAAAPKWSLVGLRYFNVYGPNEAHKENAASMVYQLACRMKSGMRPRLFKHGKQKRDFVYVKDVVEAALLAAARSNSGIYNIGSGRARSFNELVAVLNEVLATSLEPEYFDNPYPFYQSFTEADITAAADSFGYSPRFSLEEGVRDYLGLLSTGTWPADDEAPPRSAAAGGRADSSQ